MLDLASDAHHVRFAQARPASLATHRFITAAMNLAVMPTTQQHSELIAN
jgi:hypothetical protein